MDDPVVVREAVLPEAAAVPEATVLLTVVAALLPEEAFEVAMALVALVAGLTVPTELLATPVVMLVEIRDVPLATLVDKDLVALAVPVLVPEEEATLTLETLYTDSRSRPPQVSPVKPLH